MYISIIYRVFSYSFLPSTQSCSFLAKVGAVKKCQDRLAEGSIHPQTISRWLSVRPVYLPPCLTFFTPSLVGSKERMRPKSSHPTEYCVHPQAVTIGTQGQKDGWHTQEKSLILPVTPPQRPAFPCLAPAPSSANLGMKQPCC